MTGMMHTGLRDESSQHSQAPRRTTALIALGLFALALTRLLVASEHTPFNRDEARWVYHASAVRHVLDPLGSAWGDTVVNRDQPPLAAYLFGVGQVVQGRPLGAVGWWNMSRTSAWNAKHGNMPAPADLRAARRTNAVAGALAAVALFLLVARLTNLAGGIVASLFLIAHPLATQLASTVDADTLLTLLILLAALAGVWLAERPSWPRAFVVGGLLGLGGAAKLTPLVIAVGLVGFGAVVSAAGRRNRSAVARARAQRYARMLGAQPIVAGVVFVAVSPYLWRDPVGRTRRLFAFRSQEMTNQRRIWPNLAITTPLDTLHRLWRLLGQRATASGWVTDQALRLAGASWQLPGVDLGLGLAGLAVIALIVRRVGVTSSTALAAAIVGGEAVVAVVGMRVYFARYLMPVTLALAASIGVLAGALWTVWERRRAGPPAGAGLADFVDRIMPGGAASPVDDQRGAGNPG